MAYNNKSKQNLITGRPKGAKGKLARLDLADFGAMLVNDRANFDEMMHKLAPKDYCDVYIKMLKLVNDARPELAAESNPVFTIEIVPASIALANEVKEITDNNE